MKTLLSHCSTQALNTPGHDFRLLLAGLFSATDGRPQGLPGWRMSRAGALEIIKLAAARVTDFVIDYEHQSLNTASNGKQRQAESRRRLVQAPGMAGRRRPIRH